MGIWVWRNLHAWRLSVRSSSLSGGSWQGKCHVLHQKCNLSGNCWINFLNGSHGSVSEYHVRCWHSQRLGLVVGGMGGWGRAGMWWHSIEKNFSCCCYVNNAKWPTEKFGFSLFVSGRCCSKWRKPSRRLSLELKRGEGWGYFPKLRLSVVFRMPKEGRRERRQCSYCASGHNARRLISIHLFLSFSLTVRCLFLSVLIHTEVNKNKTHAHFSLPHF